jgi:aminoglycoside phosphotransferase (APT) family kinase protein
MTKPTPAALAWAVTAMAPGGRIVSVRGLREGGAPWLLRVEANGDVVDAVLRTGGRPDDPDAARFATTEVAALRCADRHGLLAPRLIAHDPDGSSAGEIAILMTLLPGRSRIPPDTSRDRLLALGAGVAALAGIDLTPSADLPARERSLDQFDFAADRAGTAAADLLDDAEAAVAATSMPVGRTVLVHGDLWQGNTMWVDTTMTGIIDWDSAGAGAHGIDLGGIRADAAIMFGVRAAADVLEGWQRRVGGSADDMPYWDLMAALSMPADLAQWITPIHDQGRTDLTPATMNARRDEFVRAALRCLG